MATSFRSLGSNDVPKAASRKQRTPRSRATPKRDPLTERFFELNDEFGELIDGRASGPDDFVTDPEILAQFPRPSDEEIKEAVKGKKRISGA